MPVIRRDRGRRTQHPWRGAVHRTVAVIAALFLLAEVAVVAVSTVSPGRAQAAQAPPGQGFTVTSGDLKFILKQINIAERHAAEQTPARPCDTMIGTAPDQIPDRLTSYGLRTVDGSCNNLFAGRETFASADQPFPRLTAPLFRDAENGIPAFGTSGPTSYKQKKGDVFDSEPRTVSNLIVDQTSTNPAAIAAAGHPVRSQDPSSEVVPCTTEPNAANPNGVPAGCVPAHKTLFVPNVTTDVGLSPPYNSLFTFFGQFFDHGVDQTVKSGANVFIPLKGDDPLVAGPNHVFGDGDDLPPSRRFMVLTRAQNQPGPDGILGDRAGTPEDESADDVQNANNTDSPWVDQSQTYTSHSSHQFFLREYSAAGGKPVDTGKLLGDPNRPAGVNGDTGMATWASVKKQAHDLLGLRLADRDVTNIPMIAADPYGNFLPGPVRGLPQYVTETGMIEGELDDPGTPADETVPVPGNARHFDTPFLTDIAHNADPSPQDTDNNPATPPVAPTPDADDVASADFAHQPAGTYDDEMLNAHFCAGDGRVNENIALTSVHQIFHSEHDRLVDYIKGVLEADTSAAGAAILADWQRTDGRSHWNYGQRLFQAARFITEMEYQHLVFEEFARKVQPAVRPFHVYHADINAAIPAEFAHAVYRFGHSMLDDQVARVNEAADGTKSDNSLPLLDAFLNPPEYFHNGAGQYNPSQAAGSVLMGSSDQVGNELDEFVTETLRNNLLGLPLDLPSINMARAREAGVPPLNVLRRQIHADTNDGQLAPYTDWSDFGQHLKHPESLVNFVAAYGRHPSIADATTLAAKRAAAKAIVDPSPGDTTPIPDDAADFMFSSGAWANGAGGVTKTGVDDIDLWVGGLSEVTNLFGGLLGSTFNYVFQSTLENLQEGDRLYYLARTPGMNLRTQLEGNSFAEMIQRNTDGTHSLKADAFATADCKFELGRLTFPAVAGEAISGPGSVHNDPNSECDENALLLHKPDGTIQYRSRNSIDPPGINGQGVYNGTSVVDRIFGGNDNDTIWGGGANDIIEGNGGDDVALGGEGDDVVTDLDGADVLKGGADDDALDGGPGDDIILGGDGQDVTNGGSFDNETFGGPGDDFVIAGQGADAVFGDGGSDWIEGGSGQDLLQGDHAAPFFDDPATSAPGHEVMVGQVGENDYDAEGGDDLMAQNAAVDRNAGAGGFDWAFHQYDTVGADDDMKINQLLDALPLPLVVNRDRWQETEANSGSAFNDTIRGDDDVPSAVGGAGFTGCDALDQAGVDRISGLNEIVTTLPTPLATVTAASATGSCPLTGPNVWAEGNILLGGGGGDTIEGRGGDDIIDGDRALKVGIAVRDKDPAHTLLGTTDLIEHAYQPGGATLQADVFAGKIDPGNLSIKREIVTPDPTAGTIDTAVFTADRANYTITFGPDAITVRQDTLATGQRISDGIDTVRNVEALKFADQTVRVGPVADVTPASLGFGSRTVNTPASPAQNATVRNTGNATMHISAVTLTGTDAAQFSSTNSCGATLGAGLSCTVAVRFAPTTAGAKTASLDVTTDTVTGDATRKVALTGSGTLAPPPNRVATGTPTINDLTPQLGQTLTASTAGIADPDGIPTAAGTFRFQWQATAVANGTTGFVNLPGATTNQFRVPTGLAGILALALRYHVVVTFTDSLGHAETVISAPTARPTAGANATTAAPVAQVLASTPLGQALAPVRAATSPVAPTAGAVTVSGGASALTVAATVPAGATTVRIRVFRLGAGRLGTGGSRTTRRHVATVLRKAPKAARYRFRLTERKLRNLKAGRYLVEVRVGASARSLGPATTKTVVVGRSAAVKVQKANTRR